ncbi:MAG: aminoacyl-tRNA hydrolase [Planctomycetes bacterium]|nr:aminoacyl-tRNA hydrolase [Planctomycetota bacterium]
MRIVFGLGNPGAKYVQTRHNIGFRIVGRLAGLHGNPVFIFRFQSRVGEVRIKGQPVLLVMPQTYMNACGAALQAVLDGSGEAPASVLVVCDDFHLPLGRIRLRRGGSSGGHRGLMSVSDALQTKEFPRLRVGIGPVGQRDPMEFVLEEFLKEERALADQGVELAAQAVEVWAEAGMDAAMNRFNVRRNEGNS